MSAIIASTVGVRTMADNTLRLTIDIEPRYADEAFVLFGKRGNACAIARLKNEAAVEEMRKSQDDKPKGGALAKLAGQLCQQQDFLTWFNCESPDEAAEQIRCICNIQSRAELDHNAEAASLFHREIRIPFLDREAA